MDENYGRFEADDRSWDTVFWQRQGSEEAARYCARKQGFVIISKDSDFVGPHAL